jgi:hypothetical protein
MADNLRPDNPAKVGAEGGKVYAHVLPDMQSDAANTQGALLHG